VFIAALVVCLASAAAGTVMHFQMKFRLLSAGLPVVWFMMPWDDFRMWRTYLREAPAKHWPIWPFYAYRVILVLFIASGLSAFANADKVGTFLRR
jgi:hypothetical protein